MDSLDFGLDEFISGFFTDTVNLLVGVLPDSPFASIDENASVMQTAIGWANWFFPVTSAAQAMEGWIAAIVAALAGKAIIDIIGQGFEIITAKELLP